MKAVWKGSIAFGLVNVPVRLYSAVESHAIGFRMLHSKCKTPIKYHRWCPECDREVEWADIVKGLEIRKGQFYVIDKKTLEELRPQKSETIDIVEFVDAKQVDPLYFNKHYFVVPDAQSKAYYLFKDVLETTAKMAVGRFVLRDKEYVCAIESYRKGLLLSTLNYAYEVRDIDRLPELQKAPKMTAQERKLARELVQRLHADEFRIERFKDSFAEDLKKLLKKREKGEVVVKKVKKRPAQKDLISALKASVK